MPIMITRCHKMPFGAEVLDNGTVRFRLWAPAQSQVTLCLYGELGESFYPMVSCEDGWFELVSHEAQHGSRYHYVIDGLRIPDPASRFQPDDVHGPSTVLDPTLWQWDDGEWRGRPWEEAVFYELHVGTFSPEGDYAGVEARLDYLQQLGITALQLMPLGDFPGRYDWGYNGVLLFAPEHHYGRPEDLKRLVAAAHRRGLMVFLDVVYNHFGPEGNYLHHYAPQFFRRDRGHVWGDAINVDGPESPWVRSFFIHNACYWLEEYGVDGLRLDAVHAMHDLSHPAFLQELATTVRQTVGQTRQIHLVLENDDNAAHLLAREPDGAPRFYVAQWNDDLHHALHRLLTGEGGGYYGDYRSDSVQDVARGFAEGFIYQGEWSRYRNRRRGEVSNTLPPTAFVNFLQNHDQVGNRPGGERLPQLARPEALRAATVILLLAPAPPLLFMGQEWGSRQPFTYFCDLASDFASQVVVGRRHELAQLLQLDPEAVGAVLRDPTQEATFAEACLRWEEGDSTEGQAWRELHHHLLELRRDEITPQLSTLLSGSVRCQVHGTTLMEATWIFANEVQLVLRANLAAHAAPPLSPPAGRLLYATSEAVGLGQWPPWSVGWWMVESP